MKQIKKGELSSTSSFSFFVLVSELKMTKGEAVLQNRQENIKLESGTIERRRGEKL